MNNVTNALSEERKKEVKEIIISNLNGLTVSEIEKLLFDIMRDSRKRAVLNT